MDRKQKYRVVISLVMGILLLSGQFAFSIEPSVTILGDVVGKGSTEMKAAFNKWISISDKAYPLMDGSHLRSGAGMMSSIFRDGARMEIGKNSEIIVTGARGTYAVDLSKGKIAFSMPQGISFSVTTPTATVQTQVQPNIIQKVSTTSQDYIRGTVGYDGKGTTITAMSGTIMVRDARGAAAHTVTAGNSVYIAGEGSGHRATPAQLAEPEAAPRRGSPTPGDEKREPALSPFVPLGGAALLGGTYLYVNSRTKVKGVASPYIP